MASSTIQKSLQQQHQQPITIIPSTSKNTQVQQHHVKLQQQNSLPLQLLSYNKQLQQHGVTTTQPSSAGTFKSQQQTASLRNSSINSNLMLNGLDLDSGSVTGTVAGGGGGDVSPISSTASFSSADTNQTLLNVIMASHELQQQQQQQQLQIPTQQQSLPATPINSNFHRGLYNNRSYRSKYSQFMIITPAVSIDRDFVYETSTTAAVSQQNTTTTTPSITRKKLNANNDGGGASAGRLTTNTTIPTITTTNTCTINKTSEVAAAATATTSTINTKGTINQNFNNMEHIDVDDMSSYFNNSNNNFRMSLLQGSIDSGCSSDSGSFRSNYNPYLHTSRQHLLPKSTPQNFYTFSSWRWCTLLCAAMRCFGAGGHSTHASYSTSFVRPPYQRTRSHGYDTNSTSKSRTTSHKRLRPSSSFTAETAFEHFSAPFTNASSTTRKNNITYEL